MSDLEDLIAKAYFRTANAARAFILAIDNPTDPLALEATSALEHGPIAAEFIKLREIVRYYEARIPKHGPHTPKPRARG